MPAKPEFKSFLSVMHTIKAVIFDLGGVLINLDPSRTRQSFVDLGIPHFEELFTVFKATPLFDNLETGHVEPDLFFETLQKEAQVPVTAEQMKQAWNAMLLDFRKESLDFIYELKSRYPVYLYSNTNRIHYDSFQETLRETTPYSHLNDLFHKAYYSHEMGYRKPHMEGYLHIVNEQGLNAGTTLFVDDNDKNIEGAMAAGLQTHQLMPGRRIEVDLAYLLSESAGSH